MKDEADLLWRFYQEHCAWERHHESQRASATNLVLVIAAGVLSVITFNGDIGASDLPLAAFLIILGAFGAILSTKHYERFARHQSLANGYRKAIDQEAPGAEILNIRERVEGQHAARYGLLYRSRLHWLWIGLHLVISIIGLTLLFGATFNWFS